VRADTPEAGQWRGLSGLATAFREFFRAWDNAWLEATDYRELDHDRVFVAVRFHGRGKASGVDLGQVWTKGAGIYRIRDGQVVKLIAYAEYDRALADLRLEEYAVPEESTTPDLAELSQRLLDAGNAGDIDAAMSFYAHDAVYDARRGGLRLEGREAIRGFFEEWSSVYEEVKIEVQEGRDLGHGVMFTVISQRARLPNTTAWAQEAFALVSIWADGLIQHTASYLDIDEGRAAAERVAEERR
jgi:hypothetical protein